MNLLEHKRAVSPEQRWIFSKEELQHLPSIRDGMRAEEEMEGRRRASEFIHKMSEILNRHRQDNSKGKISKLCMSVAMAHLHRFFCIHSMRVFDPVDISAACLFLASKSEECCRKLADFAQAWWEAKGRDPQKMLEPRQLEEGSAYMALLEGFVLQTVGFSLHIEIPHSIVLRTVNTHEKIRLKNAHKIGSIAYEFCTFALEKMNWFVRYRVRTIAMVCLALAWSWSPDSEAEKLSSSTAGVVEGGATNEESDVRPWYMSMEPSVSEELLSELTDELIVTRDRLKQEDTSQKKPFNPTITARKDAAGTTVGPNVEQSTIESPASNRQDQPLGPEVREVKVEIKVEEVLSAEAGTPPAGAQQKSQRKLALSEYLWRKKEGNPILSFLTANVIRSGHPLAAVTTTPLDVNMDGNAPCEPRNNNAPFSSPSSTASSSITAAGSVDGKLVTDQSDTAKTSPPPPPPPPHQRRSFIPTATLGDLSGRSIPEMSLELPAGIELLEQKPPAKNHSQPGQQPSGSCSPSNRKQPHNRHAHGGDGERRLKSNLPHEDRKASKDWNSPSKRSERSPEKNRRPSSSHRDEQRRTHHRSVQSVGDEQQRLSHHRQNHGSEESLRRKISSASHSHEVTTSTLEHPHARSQQHRRSHQRYSDLDGTPTGGDSDVAAWSQASASGRLSNRTSVRRDSSVYDSSTTKRCRGEEGDSISGNPPLPPDDPHDMKQPLPPSPPIPRPPPPDFSDELEEGELR